MKKTIRLTERDLMRLVKRVINEEPTDDFDAKHMYKKLTDYGDNMDQQYKKIKNIREELDYLIKRHLNSGTITYIFDNDKRTPNDIIDTVVRFNKNMFAFEQAVDVYKRMVKNAISL